MNTRPDVVVIGKGLEWQEHIIASHLGGAGIYHGNNKKKNRQHMLWWKSNEIDHLIITLRAGVC